MTHLPSTYGCQMTVSDVCFQKKDRLLTPVQFQAVFDAPIKKIHGEHLLLFIAQGEALPRLGLAITKKKLKNATDRNRLKRLTREQFRLNKSGLADVDLVLIVKKRYDKTYDIGAELAVMFSKLKKMYPSKPS